MRRILSLTVFIAFLLAIPVQSIAGISVVSSRSNIFYGSGISASFGTVDYVELSPMIGMHLDSRTSVGTSILYRYRNDERNNRTVTTNDYGASLFARYRIIPSFYIEADYEYLDHEYYGVGSDTERRKYHSFLAGGGMSSPISSNAAMYMSVLYNFSYDENDSPYGDPWVVRFGISVGF